MKLIILFFIMFLLFYAYMVMETEHAITYKIRQPIENINTEYIQLKPITVPIVSTVSTVLPVSTDKNYNSYTSFDTYNPSTLPDDYYTTQYKILKENLY